MILERRFQTACIELRSSSILVRSLLPSGVIRRCTQLGLDDTVSLLGPFNECSQICAAADANDGDDSADNTNRSYGKDDIVDEIHALAEVLICHLLTEEGQEGAEFGRQVVGEVVKVAGPGRERKKGE